MKKTERPITPRRASWLAVLGLALLMAGILAPGAQARTEEFESLAPTPVAEVTSFAADPDTGIVYAQENGGNAYFSYDPRTNLWTELTPSPLNSGNNGGAAYLDGKIYLSYTNDDEEVAVYDIASDSWTTIPNPAGEGTGDITAGDGKIFMAVNRTFVEYDPATGVTTPLAEAPEMEAECNAGFEPWGGLQFTGPKIYGHQGDGCRGFAVYDIATNTWTELPVVPLVEGESEEGPVLGSAYDPVSDTYFAYGPYGGHLVYRFDVDSGTWSTSPLPFTGIDDGGMAYVRAPGYEGVYMIQGQEGPEFGRYTEHLQADPAITMSADVVDSGNGGTISYTIPVVNNGPDKATGVVVADQLPIGTKLVSATTTQGSCGGTSTVECGVGVLAGGAGATVTIKVTADPGTYTNTATVSTQSLDTDPSNDSASVSTTLVGPAQSRTNTTASPSTTTAATVCRVPKKLRSRSLSGARKALRAGHCKPGKILRHHGDKITKGRVIRGSKRHGSVKPVGTKINLTISTGHRRH
jgi:uncharacterized repeat protein (TIGR01451 family)